MRKSAKQIIISLQELQRASLPVGSPRCWCHHAAAPHCVFAGKHREVQQDIGCAAEQSRQHEAQQEEDPPPSMSLVHIDSYGLLWLHLQISMATPTCFLWHTLSNALPLLIMASDALLQTRKAISCFLQQLFISARFTKISDSLSTIPDTTMIVSDLHLRSTIYHSFTIAIV